MNESPRCELCKAPNAELLWSARDHLTGDAFNVFYCKQCDGAFTGGLPENLDKYYPPTYRNYGSWSRRIFEFMYRMQTKRWSKTFGPPGSVLEIGCGHGWMLNALRGYGWQVCGLERSEASASFAANELKLPVHVGDLNALEAKPAFDLIVMHHVLEHLPNPAEILRQCAARLKENGTVVVAVPNRASWQFRASGPKWFHLDVPRHLSHFTPECLQRLCEPAGLHVERVRYVSLDQDPFGWMVSFLNLLGFPQTRWLHWMAGRERGLFLQNAGMLLLSPPLLLAGFILAPLSWMAGAGAVMEAQIVKRGQKKDSNG
jgi:SAM-dependent methyltransferase